jgi:hypothetical protein
MIKHSRTGVGLPTGIARDAPVWLKPMGIAASGNPQGERGPTLLGMDQATRSKLALLYKSCINMTGKVLANNAHFNYFVQLLTASQRAGDF